MFTEMRVRNFKSWADSGSINLAPVTGFFGTNSSGKTSLLQALLLMKQTVESVDRRQVLDLGDERSPLSLGLIGDVIYDHDLKSHLGFEFSWRATEPIEARDPDDPDSVLFRASDFSFRTNIGTQKGRMYVEDFSYEAGEVELSCSRRKAQQRKKPEYDLTATVRGNNYLKRVPGRVWGLPSPVKCYGFPDEAFTYFQNAAFLNLFEIELEEAFSGYLFYLGPLRQYPTREYRWQGAEPWSIGVAGERSIEALLASRQRSKAGRIARALRSDGRAKRLYPVEQVVGEWLREMDLVHEFDVQHIAPDTDIYRVMIRRSAQSARVSLPDVGFGVSQVLPVLVMLASVPKGSVVILEQPELHLHPAVQAGLADVILETARVGRAQIILESHSEYLLRRLQRRIAEGVYSPDEVALHFCDHGEGESRIKRLDLNLLGEIVNWPSGFFGDPIGEAVAMVEAGAKRTSAG